VKAFSQYYKTLILKHQRHKQQRRKLRSNMKGTCNAAQSTNNLPKKKKKKKRQDFKNTRQHILRSKKHQPKIPNFLATLI
jgi:hypothetical protein